MKKPILLILSAISICLIGCDKLDNSPMAKLKSEKKYPELANIWKQEHAKDSKLWHEAIDFCNARDGWFGYKYEMPNCRDVMEELTPTKVTNKLNSHPINDTFDFN